MTGPGKPVLVIRSAGAAESTARALHLLGREAILLPVSEIRDTGAEIPKRHYDAVALTSAAAARAVCDRLARIGRPAWLDLPAFCVGDATAAAARRAGWAEAVSAGGDAAALATLLAERFAGKHARILYPCAVDRAFDLAGQLAVHGIEVAEAAIYQARLLALDCRELSLAVARCAFVLLHSRRTAAHFFSEAARCGVDLSGLTMLSISEKVARAIPAASRSNARVAERPEEAALLALLEPRDGDDPEQNR